MFAYLTHHTAQKRKHRNYMWAFVCALLAAMLTLTLCEQTLAQGAASALNSARESYRKRDYVTAKKEAAALLRTQPDWAEAHLLLALIAWQEKKNDEAINQARKTIKLDSKNSTAHYLLARLYFQTRGYIQAEESIRQSLELGAQSADAYVLSGDIALARQKVERALQLYEQALKQPAPRTEITDEFNRRLHAVRNRIEISLGNDRSSFVPPKFAGERKEESVAPVSTTWGGVIDETGKFDNGFMLFSRLAATDGSFQLKPGKIVKLNPADLTFTPARLNDKSVPYWVYITLFPQGIRVE